MKKYSALIFATVACFLLISNSSFAAKCKKEDFVNFVSTNKKCMGIDALNEIDKSKSTLVIFLHGDYAKSREERIHDWYTEWYSVILNSIDMDSSNFFYLARPGYKSTGGNKSSGGDPQGTNRGDNYIWKRVIKPVGHAIQNLKEFYNPEHLVVIGHSGGAATTGILIGRFPGLIDEAVLIACPCITKEWRRHRMIQRGRIPSGKNLWPRSDSAHKHVAKISEKTNVHVIVGEEDENTLPKFSEEYVALLNEKNESISTNLLVLQWENHRSVLFDSKTISLIENIIHQRID